MSNKSSVSSITENKQHQQEQQQRQRQRVLSIQSHVVYGYVGNKAAVFPLQLLGFDVDVVNSVHFSNHTGHPGGVEGDVLNGEQLRCILNGLERNRLLNDIGHVLTGYIGSGSFLRAVIDVLKTLRSIDDDSSTTDSSRRVRYVCDPVMGDNGEFYVPAELVSIYRDEVIPLADVVTPNQFEAEQITGIPIKTLADAKKACRALHDLGPELVFITSMVIDETDDDNTGGEKAGEGSIAILASRRLKHGTDTSGDDAPRDEVWRIDSPVIPGHFTGTGDLCAALLLGHTAKDPGDLPACLERVVGTMFNVIKRTAECSADSVKSRELKLIQSKGDIENPLSMYKAQRIS